MKKGIFFSSSIIAAIALMGFTYRQSEPEIPKLENPFYSNESSEDEPASNFFYDYGPRFDGVTKSTLRNATLITDLFRSEDIQDVVAYGTVMLVLIENEQQAEIRAYSEGTLLTDEQKALLNSLDYSDNFNLRADCKRYDSIWDETREGFHSPHWTIVPEKQAAYLEGKDALLNYLMKGSEDERILAKADIMRPAKLYFTVTKHGTISDVKIGNRSGYEAFDARMVELLQELPGKWTPAENEEGEKIDQELVVSWGFEGC